MYLIPQKTLEGLTEKAASSWASVQSQGLGAHAPQEGPERGGVWGEPGAPPRGPGPALAQGAFPQGSLDLGERETCIGRDGGTGQALRTCGLAADPAGTLSSFQQPHLQA